MKHKINYVIKKTVNDFLRQIFGFHITKSDTNSFAINPIALKIFSKCKLKYSDEGFYFLSPMPTTKDLNAYYSSTYWDSRGASIGKNYGISTRDIVHYRILKEFIPHKLKEGNVFVNFGAGNGGVSNLLWLNGIDVLNVEPSTIPKFYNERWKTVKEISEVQDNSVDILYGSHSLEHVQDIDTFKTHVSRILKADGFVFWEVPNANDPKNGAQNNHVDIPHTYYFQKKFFNNWFSKLLLCDAYEQSQKFDIIQDWQKYKNEKGSVIRALGQITK